MSTFIIVDSTDTGSYSRDARLTNNDGTVAMVQSADSIDISCKTTVDNLLTALKTAAAQTTYTAFATALIAIPLP